MELVSGVILNTHTRNYTTPGKVDVDLGQNYLDIWDVFFEDSSRFHRSFGLRLFQLRVLMHMHVWVKLPCSRKSIVKRLGWAKVGLMEQYFGKSYI